jgi:shikimate kinase
MNILLCGMPGSGKSYFGAKAAQKLNWPFIDTDEWVISFYGKQVSCREIVIQEGIDFFREMETEVLKKISFSQYIIVATGGGVLDKEENIEILKNLGRLIYLQADPEVILERLLSKSTLPSYLDPKDIEGSFDALLKKRLPLYERYCDQTVDTASETILNEICYGK